MKTSKRSIGTALFKAQWTLMQLVLYGDER